MAVSVDGDTYIVKTSGRGDFGPETYRFRVSHRRVDDVRIDQRVKGKPFNRVFHYFDFGVPNSIEPPPANQVRESSG